MIFKQFYLGCLAHASYFIGDEETKTAAIVDPQRDIDQYLAMAKKHGMEIKHVILTHFHADFLAGHLELRDTCGATIYFGARAKAEFDATYLAEGESLEFGKVRLSVLETPGHTPESISILVYDLAESADQPMGVLTGDTLFIGDVGRPDLLASIGFEAKDLAEMLYDSITNKLAKLPDETKVYPAHGAGSLCGKNLSSETVSTIGVQKEYNYAMQLMSKDEFMKVVMEDQPMTPQYFVHDAILNRKERPTLDKTLEEKLKPLSVDEVMERMDAGDQIIDVREAIDFAGAHLKGSLNIGLQGKYATWAGTVLTNEKPIVIIAEPGMEQEAAMRLGRIGYDNIGGYLEHGMAALESRPDLVARTERIAPATLAEMLEDGKAPQTIDVRSGKERENGAVSDDDLHIPLNELEDRISEVPTDQYVAVYCGGGYRSSLAASILQKHGREKVMDMVGGFTGWSKGTGATCGS